MAILIAPIGIFAGFLPHSGSLAPTNLQCEHRVNPLGLDEAQPRLIWQVQSDQRDQRQSAYEILVAGTRELLQKNHGDLWDSGKILSDETLNIAYSGKPLASGMQCFWKVRVWDKNGRASAWSAPALWSMGLLKPEDWRGKWIGLDQDDTNLLSAQLKGSKWIWFPEGNPAASAPQATRYFRRIFELPADQAIREASIIMAADNEFRLFVNGRELGIGNDFHQPQKIAIGHWLKPGQNVLAVEARNVGDGPTPAGLIARLNVSFDQGNALSLDTGDSWKSATNLAPGWDALAFDDAAWPVAKTLGEYGMQPWGQIGNDDRRLPARYLRHEFTVKKKIRRATAYVCGLGFFDLFVNGKKISDDVMDPALSDYTKAAYYVAFDLTGQLKQNDNAIGVILGNGRFYAPRLGATQTFGHPKLLLQLNIEYVDGTTAQIVSDEHWKLTADGPIRANNEYDGEEYDARLEMPGWDRSGFNDAKWQLAQVVAAPGGVLKAQRIEPMRVTQILHPVAITNPAPGTYIVDMGQNFYGTVRLKASGGRGAQVRLVSSYSLNPDGTLKTADNRGARCTDLYTFKGQGTEVWSPAFKGQGFRRVQVTGFPGTPTVDNFEGLVIHTDVKPAGEFQCSNDLINRIHTALRWGMRMFLRSAPLDPDRDERQAWMGDPAKDAESEAYNFDVAPFYAKWMNDVEQSQRADGSIPDVAMYWTWGDGVEWPSVFTIIPDWFGDFYGDRRVSETHYAAMKKWVLAMRKHELPGGTLKATSYGDWCDASSMDEKVSDNGSTPRELVSSAYQYNNYRILEQLAKSMGRAEDERTFAELAEKLKTAFNQTFFDPQTHTYLGKTQCGYVLALKFGLVPEEQRDAVIANLVEDIIVKHHGHLSVGLIGMQWLMQTLTDIGRPDVAWIIATQTTRPSWGYMLSKGATTIWERWDCDTRGPGMNSEALLIQAGNLDAWFYQSLAGIRPAAPGFNKILVKPEIVGDLTWVKAHFDSPHGRIVSNWKIQGNVLTMDVTIPANTTATVVVPGQNGGSHEVGSGHYQFTSNGPNWN